MNQKIIYREYHHGDEKYLEDIIAEAWNYNRFASPDIAAKLAKAFLFSCLSNQTYTQVAEINGTPAGVIMGKKIKDYHCPFRYRIKQISSIVSLLVTREGRKNAMLFQNISTIDEQLLKNSSVDYQGEIAFFAVGSKYRGLGIGKKLFQSVLDYMERERILNFFLFTDTSCNFGFYEHQHMIRRGEETLQFAINGQQEEMIFYIYDNLSSQYIVFK